ncbi:hypothetical protein E5288_WYG012246 [Bos mutus]|uniref:Uncharacterized protein n=1 Tax=Bos mutus TaxID=72004 RepID=A0A6B0RFB7_9CETA|nr:hypothetical protein [Bos mutus]
MLVCSMPLKGPAHIDVYCTDDTELGQAISSACLSSVAPEPMAWFGYLAYPDPVFVTTSLRLALRSHPSSKESIVKTEVKKALPKDVVQMFAPGGGQGLCGQQHPERKELIILVNLYTRRWNGHTDFPLGSDNTKMGCILIRGAKTATAFLTCVIAAATQSGSDDSCLRCLQHAEHALAPLSFSKSYFAHQLQYEGEIAGSLQTSCRWVT